MSDVSDAINEAVETANESRLNAIIALIVAVAATFMALCGVKAGNIGQAMEQAQTETVDTWSFYQAKSMKQNLAENSVAQMTAIQSLVATPDAKQQLADAIDVNKKQIDRYEAEKAEIKAQAEALQAEYDRLGVHDDQFDLSEAALSVAIALCGITALTQKRWLLGVSGVFLCFGFFWGIAGFMELNVNPGALMGWLS